jgi:BirA family biotin operon repressor/biotin-[acetyl-CoA-carboxylase] ligase
LNLKGFDLVRYDEIDSTNAEAIRRGEAGESGPLWIMAQSQTAGRGRRGRVWVSPRGNLMTTLLLVPARGQSEWPQLSFAAALAVADMAQGFAPGAAVALKWPNDVLGNGRKLAGLLLERAGPGLAVGIGVNLAHHPSETEFPATSLAALGVSPPDPDRALAMLASAWSKWYEAWVAQGFAPLREAWLKRAMGLGARIRARLAGEERFGVFEGIDQTGALLLKEGGHTRAITAGEVFF